MINFISSSYNKMVETCIAGGVCKGIAKTVKNEYIKPSSIKKVETTWMNNWVQRGRDSFLGMSAPIGKQAFDALKLGKDFLYQNRRPMGGALFIIALLALGYRWSRSQSSSTLTAELKSSLNYAKLLITTFKSKAPLQTKKIVFVVDRSGSMGEPSNLPDSGENTRLQDVVKAMTAILHRAQNVVDGGTPIQIEVLTFNTTSSTVISKQNLLRSDQKSNIQEIKQKLNALKAEGETNLREGLAAGVEALENMKDPKENASYTLVFLTDGQEIRSNPKDVQQRLANIRANFFAVGIGKDHDKTVLKQLVKDFNGEYYDTTLGQDTIQSAINKIFSKSIAKFQIEISSTLPAGSWTVDGASSMKAKGLDRSFCQLDGLEENTDSTYQIELLKDKTDVLDLSKVEFSIHYKDDKDWHEKVVPWNPNTMIRPDIINS